ncbi:MAG: penicillin-binding protein activator [Pseudomonadota bacterium]
MLVKSLNCLLAAAALVHLSAGAAPCAPGRLCAPNEANTSAQQDHPKAEDVLAAQKAAAPALLQSAPAPSAPGASNVPVQTMPVAAPDKPIDMAPPAKPVTRIALLLPLRSDTLGPPSEALRAGFMAAFERDRDGFAVNLVENGDSAEDTLDAYKKALAENDIVVGPLARSAVGAIAASGAVAKTTIALNYPDSRGGFELNIPAKMLVMGLSIEDEARQVAQWAGTSHPGAVALIVSGTNSWQRRIASAFAAHWKQMGFSSQTVEVGASNGYLSEAALNQLKLKVDAEPYGLLFAALDVDQLRQVRSSLGNSLPAYGTSSINPGSDPGLAQAELDGMNLLDIPWQVTPDHPAVMIYPRWTGTRRSPDLDRLYALGIDAFRIARELSLKAGAPFMLDGVTGKLNVVFGSGPSRFERVQPVMVYQGGLFKPSARRR